MKKKTIRRIVAGIFTAVMVIAALPQAGVSAYAKTSLPVKNYVFQALNGMAEMRYYQLKISGNKISYEYHYGAYGDEFKKIAKSYDGQGYYGYYVTRSYGTIYDVKKVSNKKYTFRIRNNAQKNSKRKEKLKYTITNSEGEIINYTNVFKNGAKMTLYLPGYRISRLPDDYGDDRILDGIYNKSRNELKDMKLKGYALYVTYRPHGLPNGLKHSLLC